MSQIKNILMYYDYSEATLQTLGGGEDPVVTPTSRSSLTADRQHIQGLIHLLKPLP